MARNLTDQAAGLIYMITAASAGITLSRTSELYGAAAEALFSQRSSYGENIRKVTYVQSKLWNTERGREKPPLFSRRYITAAAREDATRRNV